MDVAEFFEAVMMICFGWAWPVAIFKTLKIRKVHGQSVVFLFLVLSGYLSGLAAKFVRAGGGLPPWATVLYVINALMVAFAIVLYFRFHQEDNVPALTIKPESPSAEVVEEDRVE